MTQRKKFLLRLDPTLWQELVGWAEQDLRSVNAQIEFILRNAVHRRKKGAEAEANRSKEPSGPE